MPTRLPPTRGLLVTVALALVLTTACSRSDSAASPSGPGTSARQPKVTVAGDSISVGLGASLRQALGSDVDVKVIGEGGSGLARPDNFDWPARLEKLAREFPPTVLVFSVGSNDAQDLTDADGKDLVPFTGSASGSPPSAAWDDEYTRRIEAAFDAFASSGTRVVWVGHLRTSDPKVGLTNRHIHQLAATAAQGRSFVQVADFAQLLGTGDGVASRCLEKDGLHLTTSCLDEAANSLQPQLDLAP